MKSIIFPLIYATTAGWGLLNFVLHPVNQHEMGKQYTEGPNGSQTTNTDDDGTTACEGNTGGKGAPSGAKGVPSDLEISIAFMSAGSLFFNALALEPLI